MVSNWRHALVMGLSVLVLSVLALPGMAANPPFCPHIIGFTTATENWTANSPWVKVLYWKDIIIAKNRGVKVFYRPYEIPNHDDYGCGDGIGMATEVLRLLKNVPQSQWPDAIGYRNEFGGNDTTTTAQFINYYDKLRAGDSGLGVPGYQGMIIFGSYSTGVPESYRWGQADVVAAVNKSDGIETHEYFDLTFAFCNTWLCCRHVRFINDNPYLLGKPWFIGEAGSDRIGGGCHEDPCSRRGWRHIDCAAQKLTVQGFIDQLSQYRAACANQIVAVFVFQTGDGGWYDFDPFGTPVADWMQGTWASSNGTIAGNVKNNSSQNLSGATVSTTTGGYTSTTDANGNYTLAGVAAGTYSVVASKAGYGTVTQTGKIVTAGQTTTVNFTLNPVTPGAIAGNVKNAGAQNISGATVSTTTGGYSATTDANGNYTISSVSPGTYNVVASKAGYVDSTQTGKTVASGATTTVNFTLNTQPFSGILNTNFESGFYNDPDSDHSVANSWTKFVLSGNPKYNGPWLTNWHSGNYGQLFYESSWTMGIYQQATGCTIGNNYTASIWVKGGDTDLKFWVGIDPTGGTNASSTNVQWSAQSAPGNVWTQISKQVAATSSTITMFIKSQNVSALNKYASIDDAGLIDNGASDSGAIAGNVKDGSGVNISGATVSTTSGGYTTTTDANGNFTLADMAPATYSVVASKTGYNSQTQTGKAVTVNNTTTCNFTITRQTGTISGNVKDGGGVNVSGATVSTTTGGYTTTTNSSGNYTLANVATGTYDVVASKTGYNSQTQAGKTVTNGATTTVNFTITAQGGIVAEDFNTVPTWDSYYDATWGSAATWSSVTGGQSGNFLQASRTSQGSSSKVKVYTVPTNTNITVSCYMNCPSYANSYWVEFACKFGSNTAQNFDSSPGTWTMIKKFANSGFDNGNGNTWTNYSTVINTGSNTQISIGYKHGASGCVGPTVGWDTFRIQ